MKPVGKHARLLFISSGLLVALLLIAAVVREAFFIRRDQYEFGDLRFSASYPIDVDGEFAAGGTSIIKGPEGLRVRISARVADIICFPDSDAVYILGSDGTLHGVPLAKGEITRTVQTVGADRYAYLLGDTEEEYLLICNGVESEIYRTADLTRVASFHGTAFGADFEGDDYYVENGVVRDLETGEVYEFVDH